MVTAEFFHFVQSIQKTMKNKNICLVILHIVIMFHVHSLFLPLYKSRRIYSIGNKLIQMSSSTSTTTNTKRISSNGHSLDTQFVSENLDTVLSHLHARRSSPELIKQVSLISELRQQRNSLIQERDISLNSRKTLSQQIGTLIKEGKGDSEIQALKAKVDEMNELANKATFNLEIVDGKINSIFCIIPNLLDDRYGLYMLLPIKMSFTYSSFSSYLSI